MKRVTVDDLPDAPLAAAGVFHQHWLPHVQTLLEQDDVLLAMAAADHTHREWRQAIAAGLARAHAPRRLNIVAGSGLAVEAAAAYLAAAPGVTGQYLELDGEGAGPGQ
jgi:hypothetical protein